ncbi:MAG: Na+/H+ antiporter subunit D [Thermoprotei archaeon]|nr:MAG: Na+/H+ antiporter subunit D [Thermoprotei archaeon]
MNTQLFLLLIPYVFLFTSILYKKRHRILRLLMYTSIAIIATYLYSSRSIDAISLVLALPSTYVSLFISLYTDTYSEENRYPPYLPVLIDSFSLTMISAFIAPNLLGLVTMWTIAELVGFILVSIGEKHSIEGGTKASKIFLFISTMKFELSVFTLIAIASLTVVGASTAVAWYEPLTIPYWELAKLGIEIPLFALPLAIIGFITKMGLVPLHFWLPEAHSVAPSPASALLSGVMTAMGVYGLLRLVEIYTMDHTFLVYTLLLLGSLSIIYGGLQSAIQRDGKKLLAYSTIAGNGFTALALSYYVYTFSPIGLATLLVAVLSHMGYKTTLFLNTGLLEQMTGFRYIHRSRGLATITPLASAGGLLALFSLIGIPPTAGFTAKLLLLIELISSLDAVTGLLLLASIAYIVISVIIALTYAKVYFGEPSSLLGFGNRKIGVLQEYSALLTGASNILFVLVIAVYPGLYQYLTFYVLSSPLVLLIAYLFITVARRKV